jgi:hypothetical protein
MAPPYQYKKKLTECAPFPNPSYIIRFSRSRSRLRWICNNKGINPDPRNGRGGNF